MRRSAHLRIPRAIRLILAGVVGLAAITLAVFLFLRPLPHRVTIALATDPALVWSWDTEKNLVTVIALPAEAVTDGAWGYGKYSLEALWKLGYIQNHQGTLFTKSLTHALALPTQYFWGEKTDSMQAMIDPLEEAKALFSWGNSTHLVSAHTNIPIRVLAAQLWSVRTAKADQFTLLDLTRAIKTVKEELPDGSKRIVIDTTQIDELLAHELEEDAVRAERMSVAIYNTTATPALGGKVARVVNAIGAFVIAVGNDAPEIDECTIAVAEEKRGAVTVARLKEIFGCTIVAQSGEERADIALRVGSRYEAEFSPPSKP